MLVQVRIMKKIFGFVLFFLTVCMLPISLYGQQADDYLDLGQDGEAYHILQKQLETAKQHSGFPRQIAIGHLKLGAYYHSLGLYTEALAQYNFALEQLVHHTDDMLYAELNNNIGKVYLSLSNFELAEQYFEETKAACDQLGDKKGLATSLGLLGASHEKQSEYEEALNDQRKSLTLFKELEDDLGTAMTNENIGSIYEDLEQFDLAYDYFSRAYDHLKGTGTEAEANVLKYLGDIFRK